MKYTNTHEWIAVEGDIGIVGITQHAREELGDIVYIAFPKPDTQLNANEEVCVLESTKAAADIYSPVSGTILAINEKLQDNCSLINISPEEEGWLFKIRLSNPLEVLNLMSADEYMAMLSS